MAQLNAKCTVGIDVSKQHLDVAVTGQKQTVRLPNDTQGFQTLVAQLPQACAQIVLEATGGYEQPLCDYVLAHITVPVARVNPRSVRHFAQGLGYLAKTDALDARVIAEYGAYTQPRPLKRVSSAERELDDLRRRRQQVVAMLSQEKQRRDRASATIQTRIQAHIDFLEKERQALDKQLEQRLADDPEWAEKNALLSSIPGIGQVTILTLLTTLPELGKVSSKAIAALAGVAPLNRDSGQYRGRRSTWGGRRVLRSILYMATLTATRCNACIRAYYQRLVAAGKTKKVAIVACMRKLLVIMNSMIKLQQPWRETTAMN
ncbi:MAG: IS110 family transposase [Phycisphaerae bacterium]|nr:IS110 family transposase [Gammaproteobacteria bacterium]NIV01676.1 IS110 family transposase [Phycisphaerae bacterium]NIV69880.1 IS110 family transposase [Phycisphaerae bacterium]